ncbi:MAG: hypothetical protein KatS3mg103_0641 [Phycisphaerales bacterium]|nr:MAG: hypothetical protein KatS3mg103_0641 [Phycisphaerales bacterium]
MPPASAGTKPAEEKASNRPAADRPAGESAGAASATTSAGSAGSATRPQDRRPAANRPKRVKPPAAVMPEGIGGLLAPGGPAPKPLIASTHRQVKGPDAKAEKLPTKSPFTKRELEKFRQILLAKRAEVLSEVAGLEGDALTGQGSGNLSKTPQHMADAGSDAADQTISLDLAAAERNLLREIDAALQAHPRRGCTACARPPAGRSARSG